MNFTLNIKTPEILATEALAAERAGMRAFRRALRRALTLFPSDNHIHRLAEIDAAVATLPEYDAAKLAWGDVTEFQRMNPDVLAMAVPFGFDETSLDALFRVAMALENDATDAEALAAI